MAKGLVNVGGGGGSGGGVKSRIYIPKGADLGYDDEFDDGSISSAWTNIDVSGYKNSWYEPEGLKGLSCYVPSGKGGFKLCGKLKSIGSLTAPFYIETTIKINGKYAGYPSAGLMITNGVAPGSGTQVEFLYNSYSRKLHYAIYTNFTSRGTIAEIDLLNAVQDCLYLRLVYVSSNTWSFYFSNDGVTWCPLAENVSITLTPSYMGIAENSEDNSTYPFMVNYGYFRARSGSPTNG